MKIQWNNVTWYSRLIALILFIALPFAGFYLGMKYQEAVNPSTTKIATNSANKNPSPGTLNVIDILANPTKYTNQKVIIQARIDIHTIKGGVACIPEATSCPQYSGTIYLKDVNASFGSTSNEIQLGHKTKTDPSYTYAFSCTGFAPTIETCDGYTNESIVTLEGTFIMLPTTNSSGNYLYELVL